MERKVPVLRSDSSLIEQEFDSIRDKFELEMRKMEDEMSRFRSQLIASEKSRLVSSLTSSSTTSSSARQKSSGSSLASSRASDSSSEGQQQQQQQQQEQLQQQQKQQQQAALHTTKKTTTTTTTTTSSKTTSGAAASTQQHQQHQLLLGAGGHSQPADWLDELNSPLVSTDEQSGEKLLRLRFDVTPYEPEQIVVKTIDNRLQIHARREEKTENSSMYREYNREFLLPQGTNPELIRSSLSADGVLTVEAPLPAANSLASS